MQIWKTGKQYNFNFLGFRHSGEYLTWGVCLQAVAPEAERSQAFPAFLTVFLNIGGVAAFAFLVRYVLQTLDMDQWCRLPTQVKETALQRSGNCTCNAVKSTFATHSVETAVETRWNLPFQLGGNCRWNSVKTAFATWWKLPLQLGGTCLGNWVETSFATQ